VLEKFADTKEVACKTIQCPKDDIERKIKSTRNPSINLE